MAGPRDPNTLSNYNFWKTKHTIVDLFINFNDQKLTGNVSLILEAKTEQGSDEIILDTSYLDIKAIDIEGFQTTEWSIKDRIEPYGSPLYIRVPSKQPKESVVRKFPYMFSQCQAIHNRSIFPCQDTPDIKSTYEFHIRSQLPVVASGLPNGTSDYQPGDNGNPGTLLYSFYQKIPIPTYLFAVAAGDIATGSIGPRSLVSTGPDELSAAKWELEEDTEHFIQVAENLIFPYPWTQYNVLVLPPSFPYGGMENPIFTFATPTIISGDRQNIDVIAHELSHSWSGNLVSNASWEHFWLNEGWTTYLERRIQAVVHCEAQRDFSSIIGWKALEDSVKLYGEDSEFTKLVIDLKGRDPDDAFSSIPYEKGFHFLYYLERLLGKSIFDQFIPHYFRRWSEKSLDSEDFKETLLDFFKSNTEAYMKLESVDWNKWFYQPGLPPKPKFDTSMVDRCYSLAEKWLSEGFLPSSSDIMGWTANQIVVFLERIQIFPKPLSVAQTRAMGEIYSLAKSQNTELSSRYFIIALLANDKAVYHAVADLLGKVGRMKFVRPLYRHLNKVDGKFAWETFEKNKNFYHPICRSQIEKDLSKNQA